VDVDRKLTLLVPVDAQATAPPQQGPVKVVRIMLLVLMKLCVL
jgi:hypothetical protein